MNHERDKQDTDEEKRIEPSLKDALMPERPEAQERRETPLPRDTYGENPSLQDALLPKDHKASPPPEPAPAPKSTPAPTPEPATPKTAPPTDRGMHVIQAIVALAIVAGFVTVFFVGRASNNPAPTPKNAPHPVETGTTAPNTPQQATEVATAVEIDSTIDWGDPGPMPFALIQAERRIIDVHEHIESLEQVPLYLAAMDQLGIQKMCLMGSSKFTLTLNERLGFVGYDENNEELMKIIAAYPDRFEAWPTINPKDTDKLEKIQDLVSRGATGVKLYLGHGYVTKKHTYMFHTVAMDDPTMLPFYAWCEENRIPLAFHVNPYKDKIGFAQEFIAVLTQFPDLKVIAPHFILSSVQSYRLEELLDTFPNLYSDVSFGDYFMKERLTYISKFPKQFRRIFNRYPNRFMFASDLVMIKGRPENWATTQLQAYLDMLSKETYTTTAIPGKELKGLALSD
ncbi:MAG: amidohydrolase family protein, partial [Candidatus Hydrogenedentes bacterium]|nr:amidohydrolase family protein [Candidatus Hydrogenedentota bacterium]